MSLQPAYTGRFKRDVKLMQKRGKDMAKLKHVLEQLLEEVPLIGIIKIIHSPETGKAVAIAILNQIGF